MSVLIKIARGIGNSHGVSSLRPWIYRIALHEASNQRRWWFRHKRRETSMEPQFGKDENEGYVLGLKDTLVDSAPFPFEDAAHEEVLAKVEHELRSVPEPYRTIVVLR